MDGGSWSNNLPLFTSVIIGLLSANERRRYFGFSCLLSAFNMTISKRPILFLCGYFKCFHFYDKLLQTAIDFNIVTHVYVWKPSHKMFTQGLVAKSASDHYLVVCWLVIYIRTASADGWISSCRCSRGCRSIYASPKTQGVNSPRLSDANMCHWIGSSSIPILDAVAYCWQQQWSNHQQQHFCCMLRTGSALADGTNVIPRGLDTRTAVTVCKILPASW